ncbi:MAG: antitoxin [Gammaproteobacteria bacterium]|nr:antitoxin [Gammaproteobacteria bacterium]
MKRTTAKVFATGRSQAVRLPKPFRFGTDEVFIEQHGRQVILTPKPKSWQQYFSEGRRFSADFPARTEDMAPEERGTL